MRTKRGVGSLGFGQLGAEGSDFGGGGRRRRDRVGGLGPGFGQFLGKGGAAGGEAGNFCGVLVAGLFVVGPPAGEFLPGDFQPALQGGEFGGGILGRGGTGLGRCELLREGGLLGGQGGEFGLERGPGLLGLLRTATTSPACTLSPRIPLQASSCDWNTLAVPLK